MSNNSVTNGSELERQADELLSALIRQPVLRSKSAKGVVLPD
ncbi:hypothetical protein [Sneathiella marina]|nr:hypothetical protein [Sneathiella marina]